MEKRNRTTSINPGPFDAKFWDRSKPDSVTQRLLEKAGVGAKTP